MSDARASRWRRWLVRLAAAATVVLVSSVVALGIAEVAVRLVAPQQLIQVRPDLWQPADTVGWLRRPNVAVQMNTGERTVSVLTDSMGYRVGRERAPAAASQILLLGDSFMEAIQVEHEQTVAHLVETYLGEQLRRPVAVRNAGVSGWNPNQYLLRGRQLLARHRFDAVVVAVFVGNDAVEYRHDRVPPREAVPQHHFRFPRALSSGEIVAALLAPFNDAMEKRSHLYVLAKNQGATLRMRLGLTADYFPPEYRRVEATSIRWRNTAELSRDLARVAATHRVPVLFVLVPERFQVYPDEFNRYVRGFDIDSSTVDLEQPTRLLAKEFAADSLRVVDALPAMRAAAGQRPRLYGRVDQHLSPAGHEALAEVVGPAVLSLLRR